MNYSKMSDMGSWELAKACYLITTAKNLGMDLKGEGEIAVNPDSGNTYLWNEDYDFTLYMPISCELKEEDVWVLWTNLENGEEVEETLNEFFCLSAIEEWIEKLRKGVEEND